MMVIYSSQTLTRNSPEVFFQTCNYIRDRVSLSIPKKLVFLVIFSISKVEILKCLKRYKFHSFLFLFLSKSVGFIGKWQISISVEPKAKKKNMSLIFRILIL